MGVCEYMVILQFSLNWFAAQVAEEARDGSIDTSMKGSSSLTKLEY